MSDEELRRRLEGPLTPGWLPKYVIGDRVTWARSFRETPQPGQVIDLADTQVLVRFQDGRLQWIPRLAAWLRKV